MDKEKQLKDLKDKALRDDKLPLKKEATNLVFGVGNVDTQILFIGEGPGYWEDIKGEPFVGNAGGLLNQLLVSIGLKRDEVYITNVVMYRPPQNRDPEPFEIKAFEPYLDGIIEIIKPSIICTLGRFSMAKFLPGVLISGVHGIRKEVQWKERQITVVPLYHPAAALRNGEIKTRLQMDFSKIPDILKESKENKDKDVKDDNIVNKQMKFI